MYGGEGSRRLFVMRRNYMIYPEFYTEEMIKISNYNNQVTRKLLNVPKGWHMHHKDETLRYDDPWRYIK